MSCSVVGSVESEGQEHFSVLGMAATSAFRYYSGFAFTGGRQMRVKLSDESSKSVKQSIKLFTPRSRGISLPEMLKELIILLGR